MVALRRIDPGTSLRATRLGFGEIYAQKAQKVASLDSFGTSGTDTFAALVAPAHVAPASYIPSYRTGGRGENVSVENAVHMLMIRVDSCDSISTDLPDIQYVS